MGSNRGAIELSIGTMVIIVLSMSMLILGLVLIKNIFSGARDITDMTNSQLKEQVSKLFGEDKKLVVYPDTRHIVVTPGEASGFGIGIKNLLTGVQDKKFSYEDLNFVTSGESTYGRFIPNRTIFGRITLYLG